MENIVVEGFRLSPQQRHLWLLAQDAGRTRAAQCLLVLRGELDARALGEAAARVVSRHEMLRTTFRSLPGVKLPLQVIAEEATALVGGGLDGDDESELPAEVERVLGEERARAWDYERGPLVRLRLLRLGARQHLLAATLPAVCADARTLRLLAAELARAYAGEAEEGEAMQYADVSEWQNELLEAEEMAAGREFWSGQDWSGCARPRLPFVGEPRAAGESRLDPGRSPVDFDGEVLCELEEAARRQGVSAAAWLQAAWQALLWRLSGEPSEFALGVVHDGRRHEPLAFVLGPLARLLPSRVKLDEGQPFAEVLEQTEAARQEAAKWQEYFSWEGLGLEADAGTRLCPSQFEYEPWVAHPEEGFTLAEVSDHPEPFRLKLRCVEAGERGPRGLRADILWDREVLSAEAAEILSEQLRVLLEDTLRNPARAVGKLALADGARLRQRLARWNDTRDEAIRQKLVHELFEEQAARTPEAVAVVSEGEQVSYAELNRRANQLAHYLRGLGVGPDTLVGLLLERSVELVVAVLGVLKAGGAYLPLDSAYPPERLRFMLEDASANLLLTQGAPEDFLPAGERVVDLDAERERLAAERVENPPHTADAGDLAYVIYTSGSTGRPKGVMISHGSICNRLLWMVGAFPLTADDRVLQKTPFSFDASVWEFFVPLFAGAQLVMARPGGHQDSAYLRKTVAEQRITTLQLVPSMLQVFLEGDDLTACNSLRRMFCGGELLPFNLQERFFANFDASLQNLYGPTEVSIDASCWVCQRDSQQKFVPIGRALSNTRLYILDAEMQPAPVGVVGELYVGGDGLARGYLKRPALTAERFVPDPFSAEPGGRLYRTGDAARLLAGGEVEFLGRRDSQIKMRGFRIEPGEIEAALCAHPTVAEAAVVARDEASGERRLVAYLVGRKQERPASASELRAHLRERVPDYMVPSAFVALDKLPLTPNGKLDRKALPAPEPSADAAQAYVAPRTPTEELVAGVYAEVLGVERVGVEDDFFELGGHSLLATRVVSRVREALGVELPLRALFESGRVGELAARIEGLARGQGGLGARTAVVRGESGTPAPLTFAQQRLWFMEQLEPGSAAYNIPAAVRLTGRLDAEALGRTLSEIERRHGSLRTVFVEQGGEARQVVREHAPLALGVEDLSELSLDAREAELRARIETEAARPFDLARGPVWRTSLLKLGEEEHVLLLTIHHIVSDGWSAGVLVREMGELYEAFSQGKDSPLRELPVQYADYARWQREWLTGDVLESQLSYWRAQLAGAPPALELPTDRPRAAVQTFRGAYHYYELPTELAGSVRELSRKEDVTPFMLTLAAFQTLLQRYTSAEDIVVGTDIANRTQLEVEKLIGLFANQIVLRADLSGDPTFRELLRRVRPVVLGAYMHQDLPFDQLVRTLPPQRDLSRNPVFQVMFVMQNVPMPALRLADVTMEPIKVDNHTAKFDLVLFVVEREDGLTTVWNYNTDLFDEATMARMSRHYETLLASAVADPDARLGKLQHLTAEERAAQSAERRERKESRRKKFTGVVPRAVELVGDEGRGVEP
jgi:amino acid adenylation domain-containing protein